LQHALFESSILEWNRVLTFQDITIRLIATRLPAERISCPAFFRGLSSLSPPILPTLGTDAEHDLFCSPHNAGAAELIDEVRRSVGVHISMTAQLEQLKSCRCMLIYLDGRTWSCSAKAEFAESVRRALELHKHLLLAHEVPGVEPDGRHAVQFATFFDDGATPRALLDTGIYATVASPLKGGVWRQASLLMLAQELSRLIGGRRAQCPWLWALLSRMRYRSRVALADEDGAVAQLEMQHTPSNRLR